MRRPPRLATTDVLITIGEFARRTSRAYRTAYSLVARLSESFAAKWVMKDGGRWKINLHLLRRAHPALFESRYVDREDFNDFTEEMRTRVTRTEIANRDLRKQTNALAARVRDLETGTRKPKSAA